MLIDLLANKLLQAIKKTIFEQNLKEMGKILQPLERGHTYVKV